MKTAGKEQSLTVQQREVLDAVVSFVAGPERVFILKGYAGTGKTFLIERIARFVTSVGRSYTLAAPTGRAARVLEDRTGLGAGTIHRMLYSMNNVKECDDWEEDARGKKKRVARFFYELRKEANEDEGGVIIVDEASMISDIYSEMEYIRFGSGYLLRDLIEFARARSSFVDTKIIFVGDPAQLQPVKMNCSPALDVKHLEATYHISCREAVLTEVVRQNEGSAILKNAMGLRDRLESTWRKPICIEAAEGEVDFLGSSQDVYDVCLDEDGVYRDDSIVISYTNATALRYNLAFRERIWGGAGDAQLQVGDRLMCVANNGTFELCNGDLVYVSWVGDVEKRVVPHHDVTLIFREVRVVLPQVRGEHREIECKILENVLFSVERQITTTEYKALYADFCIHHPGVTMKKDKEQFVNLLRDDPYFNALQVKFGYAVTCHKAQGGEWERVAVLMEQSGQSDSQIRWCYTAVTRARSRLFVHNRTRSRGMNDSALSGIRRQAALRRETVSTGSKSWIH